jgi:hypothetical protein
VREDRTLILERGALQEAEKCCFLSFTYSTNINWTLIMCTVVAVEDAVVNRIKSLFQ